MYFAEDAASDRAGQLQICRIQNVWPTEISLFRREVGINKLGDVDIQIDLQLIRAATWG